MKKKILILLVLIMSLGACSAKPKENNNLSIVTSFYPIQSLTEAITGEKTKVIVSGGGDAHDFEPSVRQRAEISDADLFIYHGSGFEFWFEESMVKNGKVLELSKNIDLIEDDEHDEHDEHEHDDHDHGGIDPHTWLDPHNALIYLDEIYKQLVEINPAKKDEYSKNYEKSKEELSLIINDYDKLYDLDNKNLVVDHHAYAYLAKRYGLNQEAIISGIAEGDASFKEIEAAIAKIKNLGVEAIYVDPLHHNDIMNTVSKEANVEILDLYTLENPVEGKTYFEMLRLNLEQLSKGNR